MHVRVRTCSYLVCADTSGSCFALALVRVAHDAFNLSQLLTVVNPELHEVEVNYKEQVRGFVSYRQTRKPVALYSAEENPHL